MHQLFRSLRRAPIQSLVRGYSTPDPSLQPLIPTHTPEELTPLRKTDIPEGRKKHSWYNAPPQEDMGITLEAIEEAYERIRTLLYVKLLMF
jgi:hypothetical protein